MRRSFLLGGILVALVGAAAVLAADPAAPAPTPAPAGAGFTLQDTPKKYMDILLDGKICGRYMYAYDTSTPALRTETYKPYLHIFDADGKAPITKGADKLVNGQEFPHHRGIFIGFQQLILVNGELVNGKKPTYNLWEMGTNAIVQQKFITQSADANSATITGEINWISTPDKPPLMVEQRTMTFRRAPAPARLIVDFTSVLNAPNGDLSLNSDPEHSGVQYRPAAALDMKQTIYVFPEANANPHKADGLPWVGETYTYNDKKYSVVEMAHPDDDLKNIRYSAYRDYGRFGAAFKVPVIVPNGKSLTLKYRFLIADGDMPAADMIEKCYDDYVGAKTPSPVPAITVKPGEKK